MKLTDNELDALQAHLDHVNPEHPPLPRWDHIHKHLQDLVQCFYDLMQDTTLPNKPVALTAVLTDLLTTIIHALNTLNLLHIFRSTAPTPLQPDPGNNTPPNQATRHEPT